MRCISNKHTVQDCILVLTDCKKCGRGKHHTALCVSKGKNISGVGMRTFNEEQPKKEEQNTKQSIMSVRGTVTTKSTSLPTATVEIRNSSTRQKMFTRAFFDQGSQCTFIKKDLVDKLQLGINGTMRLSMSGFLHTKDFEEYNVVRPIVRLGNRIKKITAVVVDSLPDRISVPGLGEAVDVLRKANVKLADKYLTSDTVDGIGLVIGGDFYGDYILALVVI